MSIPVVGFAAYSGTGKTTLIEKLLRSLKEKGLRVAVVKHNAHDFEIDQEGKDSWRFTQAGADVMLITSTRKTALIEQRQHSLRENLSMIRDVDLILVEGYKQEDIPKIGISRKESGKGFPHPVSHYMAVVTDDESVSAPGIPVFDLEDITGITESILQAVLGLPT